MYLKTHHLLVKQTVQSRNQCRICPHTAVSATSKEMGCNSSIFVDSTTGHTRLKVIMTLIRAYHSHKGRCSAFKDSMIHEIALDLQFTSHIAACYVLHRMACQGIHFNSLLSGPPSTGFRSASRLCLRRTPHRWQVAQHFDLLAPDPQPAEVRLKWTAVYSGSSGCVIAIYWLAPD
jgi:hypothetical protein